MPDEQLRRLDALLAVAMRLARSAPSGRTALAQLTGVIDLAWIPHPEGREFADELRAAAEAATVPVAPDRVERTLREAWGEPPECELDDFEADPVLVGPVAQVHRGKLDGRAVAIKVARPGLAAAVRQDLALLETLAAPLAGAFPALDVAALLREVRERVLDDLDLEHQAQALRRLHRALRDHPRLRVPAPVTRLCEETVLVRDWVEGTPVAQTAPEVRDRACAELVAFALGAARSGLAHADLQLEEVFIDADGRLVVADVGASATVDVARIDAAGALVEAFAAGDEAALGRRLAQLGWLPAEYAARAAAYAREVLGPFAEAGPVRLDSEAVVALRDRALGRPGPLLELLTAGGLEPEDLWPARGLGHLFALIARAGATAPWRELVLAGLRDGWAAASA